MFRTSHSRKSRAVNGVDDRADPGVHADAGTHTISFDGINGAAAANYSIALGSATRTATLTEAHHHLDAARACLRGTPLAPRAVHEVEELLGYLAHRTV